MNVLTFDIEEWYTEKAYHGDRPSYYLQYDNYLDSILDLLDERHLKATFFCVGQMGTMFPEVVGKIFSRGHEIGCHSNIHTWLNKMSRDEAFEDTRQAIDSLEQCIGQKVVSYRAPAFSIGKENAWAFEVLAECGIERDASVYPAVRDFGGFAEFGQQKPTVVKYGNHTIKEFPICLTRLLGKEFAYSGGGYFRFFPLWYVKNRMHQTDYNMCYFHIDDLMPGIIGLMSKEEYESYFKEPGSLKNRYMRYLKSNIGKGRALSKMMSLVSTTDFVNIETADRLVDWEKAATVRLDEQGNIS